MKKSNFKQKKKLSLIEKHKKEAFSISIKKNFKKLYILARKVGSLRIETRYGYLIDALRRYPFDKEIKERIEEITFPYQNFDENWYIKSKTAKNTPEALKNVIMKENDPKLIRLYTLTQAIEEYKAECGSTNWESIRALYVTRSKNVEGVALELFMSKNSVYRHIIKPFFEGLEKKYTSIFLKSR